MKTLLLLFVAFSTSSMASDFFERDLDHLDRIQIGNDITAEGTYTVQYPGLSNGRFTNKDCLIMHFGRNFPSQQQLNRIKKQVIVLDGAGVLFGGTHGSKNLLEPVEKSLSRGQGRKVLAYHLKNLGTYVTGVEVKAYSPYLSVSQILKSTFGELSSEVELIFLRGCEL